MRLSIKHKLLLPTLLFSALFFIIALVGHVWLSDLNEFEQQRQRIDRLTDAIMGQLAQAMVNEDQRVIEDLLAVYQHENSVFKVTLENSDSVVLFGFQRHQTGYDKTLDTLSQHTDGAIVHFSTRQKNVSELGKPLGVLTIALRSHSFEQLLAKLHASGALFFIVMITACVTLYWRAQKVVLDPIYRLHAAMQDFVEGRLKSHCLVSASEDEIGTLISAFNSMSRRLLQRENQIQHSISHLELEKAFVNDVIEAVQHALLVVRDDGTLLYHNGAARALFQKTRQEIEVCKITQLIQCSEPSLFSQVLSFTRDLSDQIVESQDQTRKKMALKVSTTRLIEQQAVLFSVQDVTEAQLAINKHRIASDVFENSQDGLLVIDNQGVITMTNPAVSRMLGYPAERLIGQSLMHAFEWHQLATLVPTIHESLELYGQWQGEIVEKHHNGQLIPLFAKVSRITKRVGNEEVYDIVVTLTDLSDVKEMERLEYLAHHDALTGLANRSKLHRVLEEQLRQCHYSQDEFALLYIDLDGFKYVNDTFGHDAGDVVLQVVAQRLLEQVGSGDLVARLSGDEFVLLIKRANTQSVTLLSERILESVMRPIEHKNQSLHVGCSIGVKLVGQYEKEIESVLKSADTAMYKAKKLGKGRAILIGVESNETPFFADTSE